MSFFEVGLEKLPNCYIRLVEIEQASATSDRYICHLAMKDLMANNKYMWYKNDYIYPYIKIMAVVSSDQHLNDLLDNGSIGFTQSNINSNTSDKKAVSVNVFSLMMSRDIETDTEQLDEGMLSTFKYTTSFEISSETSNTKLYAAAIVDMNEFSISKSVNLLSGKSNIYTGPVASETLKKNGSFASTTSIFQKEDGSTWAGPVHEHEGNYMEGSFHTSKPHGVLRQITLQNPKIKNYKPTTFAPKEYGAYQIKNPILAPMITSYDGNGTINSLFTINLKSMLVRQSFYARKLAPLNEGVFNAAMKNTQIQNIRIYKKSVSTKKGLSGTGSPKLVTNRTNKEIVLINSKDSAPYFLQKNSNERATIEEIVLNSNPDERTISLVDKNNKSNRGQYRYKILVEINDPIKPLIDGVSSNMKKVLKELKSYMIRATRKNNLKNGQYLTEKFIERQLSLYPDELESPWTRSMKAYIEAFSMLNRTTPEELATLSQQVIFSIHPRYATPRSIEIFLNRFIKCYQYFSTHYQSRQNRISQPSQRGSTKSTMNAKLIIEKTMEEIISYEGKATCLRFLPTGNRSFPNIETDQILLNAQGQVNKYYKSKPSFEGTQIAQASPELAQAFANYQNNLVTFFNPSEIQDGSKKLSLMGFPNSIDLAAFNSLIKNAKPPQQKSDVESMKSSKGELAVRPAKELKDYLQKVLNKYKNSTSELGIDNAFDNAQEEYTEARTKRVNEETKSKFNKKEDPAKKETFSLENNEIASYFEKNIGKVTNMPLSLKAVYASDSRSVSGDYLSAGNDFIENPNTSSLFKIYYTSPIKIDFINGYRKDDHGRSILTKPIWKNLTNDDVENLNEPVICRGSYFEFRHITTPFRNFHIMNEYFILKPSNNPVSKRFTSTTEFDETSVTELVNQVQGLKIEYASSNVLKQFSDSSVRVRTTSNSLSPAPTTGDLTDGY